MNMRVLVPALFVAICLFSSCKDNDESNMQYEEQMKDSIFKYYPTVASITIKVKERSEIDVILGSAQMFEKTDAERQQTANEMGMMALRLFPKDNNLDRGQLFVSKDEKSMDVNLAEAKTSKINIDSLRKAKGK